MELSQFINRIGAGISNINHIGTNIINYNSNDFKSNKILRNTINKNIQKEITHPYKIIQNFTKRSNLIINNPLDIFTRQNSFFALKDISGNLSFTKNGHFKLDNQYYITNSTGMKLIGLNINNITKKIEKLSLPTCINFKNKIHLSNRPTKNITISSILNSNDLTKNILYFNPKDKNTYSKKSIVTIYDSLGNSKKLNLFFLKKSNFIWKIYFMDENLRNLKSIFFEFNKIGHIIFQKEKDIKIDNFNSKNNNSIHIKLNIVAKKNIDKNIVQKIAQDGYEKGDLKNIFINKKGLIIGNYSNKQTKTLGQITLFDIAHTENVQLQEENNWILANNTKINKIGTPGDNYFKTLTIEPLEKYNVKLEKELIDMISAQRFYNTNIKSLKIQNQMFSTLINLK